MIMVTKEIATWQLPSGYSANRVNDKISRISAYRFQLKHYLNNGTRVIPKVTTISHVLDAFDMFGLEVAISSDSYDLYEEDTQTV